LLCPEFCQQLAQESGWCKRLGKITSFEFLFSLVFGQSSALALTLNAQAISLSLTVSRQAIDQRYTKEAVVYFQAAFAKALQSTLNWQLDSPMAQRLGVHFAAVRLFDSTQCPCSDALAYLFPACGGSGGQAGIKVLLSYEYGTSQLRPLGIMSGKRSDQGLADLAAQHVQNSEIGLFDKGFYKAQALRSIAQRGGYFLIPWMRSVSVWEINATGQRQALDLAGQLKLASDSCHEWSQVHLGQTPSASLGPVRLIAFRLSQESAGRRRAYLREQCRTHRQQPTVEALELAGWLILLTNAPAAKLPAKAAGYLYRVRWQIELIFKQWKSVLRLDVIPSDNPHRVQCEVWARLLAALLGFVWYQHTNCACLRAHQREISFSKLAKQLQQQSQSLVRTLFQDPAQLGAMLRQMWHTIFKLARKEHQPSRPTTWQNLNTHWLDPAPT
jgi:hypothetical protein